MRRFKKKFNVCYEQDGTKVENEKSLREELIFPGS